MVKLEKSRARKPLAEGELSLSGHGGADKPDGLTYSRWSIGLSEPGESNWTFWNLRLGRPDAKRVLNFLLSGMTARESDPSSWQLPVDEREFNLAYIARTICHSIETGEVRNLEKIAERLETIS